MRATQLLPLAAVLSLAAAHPARAADCLDSQSAARIAGKLVNEMFHDAAGRPERAWILVLDEPACLTGPDEFDRVEKAETLHVAPAEQDLAPRFERLMGKIVVVEGTPFGAHTAHHHAPIVMMVSSIAPR